MNKPHLTENELQQFALEQHTVPALAAHVNECLLCSKAVANYRVMFTALNTMEKPVFDFNVEKAVLAQLPVPVSKEKSSWYFIFIMVVALVIFAIPLLIMGSFLTQLFKGIPVIILDIILVTAVAIVAFQFREILVPYKEKMRLLNSF